MVFENCRLPGPQPAGPPGTLHQHLLALLGPRVRLRLAGDVHNYDRPPTTALERQAFMGEVNI